MDNPQLTQVPMTRTGMPIRKPVAEVFRGLRQSGHPPYTAPHIL